MRGLVEDLEFSGFFEDFPMPRIDVDDDDPATELIMTRYQPRCDHRHDRPFERIIKVADEVGFWRLE